MPRADAMMPCAARRSTSAGASRTRITTAVRGVTGRPASPRRSRARGAPDDEAVDERGDLPLDGVEAPPTATARGRRPRRTRSAPAGCRSRTAARSAPSRAARCERKRIDAAEPAGDQRLEPLDERAPHIEEGDARRPEQVLERAGHQEVDAQLVHVDRAAAGALVVVEQAERAALVAQPHQRAGCRAR